MSPIRIVGVAFSNYVQSVLLALREKGAAYELVPPPSALKEPAHLALHPWGKIPVALLDSGDDVLLASRNGKAIRFAADDVREFTSRTSTGVRGMTLKDGDEVVSLSILHRVGTSPEERDEYLRFAPWKAEKDGQPDLSDDRFAELYIAHADRDANLCDEA